jgi:hypothetical protein
MKKMSKEKVDIKELGIPNICFSIADSEMEESDKYAEQRKERGFDDTETWNLDQVICQFIEPRLRRFKELTNGYPPSLTPESWDEALDKMINAFSLMQKDLYEVRKGDLEKVEEGLSLFCKHLRDLWW